MDLGKYEERLEKRIRNIAIECNSRIGSQTYQQHTDYPVTFIPTKSYSSRTEGFVAKQSEQSPTRRHSIVI